MAVESQLAPAAAKPRGPEAIGGLGDEAVWVNSFLLVRKGGASIGLVWVGHAPEGAAKLEQLRRLASQEVTRL